MANPKTSPRFPSQNQKGQPATMIHTAKDMCDPITTNDSTVACTLRVERWKPTFLAALFCLDLSTLPFPGPAGISSYTQTLE